MSEYHNPNDLDRINNLEAIVLDNIDCLRRLKDKVEEYKKREEVIQEALEELFAVLREKNLIR
jgi:hypothetical protein